MKRTMAFWATRENRVREVRQLASERKKEIIELRQKDFIHLQGLLNHMSYNEAIKEATENGIKSYVRKLGKDPRDVTSFDLENSGFKFNDLIEAYPEIWPWEL